MSDRHPLKDRALELPTDPGVYVMKGGAGAVIYVGKAKNLRSRVNSYFGDSMKSVKTHAMVAEIVDFDIMITHSEVEAFLLERTLIKHHKPKFNILLKDDKNFPYIKVDFRQKWPKLRKVRKRKDDGATYVGPFANAGNLYLLMKRIYKVFPLIRCSEHVFKTTKRPCNYYHIKLCLAPCVLDVDRERYHKMVKSAVQILKGRAGALAAELTAEMTAAAEEENFEQAAAIRDQLKALAAMKEHQNVILDKTKTIDIVNFHCSPTQITFHVMWVRHYEVIGSHSVSSPLRLEHSDEDILEAFLLQYYERHDLPERIAIPAPLTRGEQLMGTLVKSAKNSGDESEGKARLKKPKWVIASEASREVKALLDQCQINAAQAWQQQEDVQQKNTASLNRLQQTLKLSRYPRRIECLDISNFGSSQKVAAIVVLEEGEYAKKLYKRYKVATVDQQDDFASIEEVVRRRLRRGLEEDDLPDVLVIDGGKGQLSAAMKAKAEFAGCELEIVSLAKSRVAKGQAGLGRSYERVFKADRELAIPLIDGTPAYLLLTKIRDEAHRFAITYHRSLRDKATKLSFLDEVKGVGKVLRGNLLAHFGSVAAVKKASVDQISAVKGVGRPLAQAIYDQARGGSADEPAD